MHTNGCVLEEWMDFIGNYPIINFIVVLPSNTCIILEFSVSYARFRRGDFHKGESVTPPLAS